MTRRLAQEDQGAHLEGLLPVLFAIFQTGNRANGGVESITQVIERLHHVRPIILTQRETPVNERWRAAGAEVHVRAWATAFGVSIRPLENLISLLRANYETYLLLRTTGCQVVHCNDIRALWHTVLGARLAGARIVFNIRDVKPEGESYDWKWMAAQLSHRILVLSQEMQRALASRLPGMPLLNEQANTPVDYIYSIVNPQPMSQEQPEAREALRERLDIPRGQVALGYVATFNEKKAQLPFIEHAGPLLKAHLPEAKVYFLGDFDPEHNPYARLCREAVQRLQLEDTFRFVGFVPNITDWYRALDVVILASRREGLARCMIESLACGTPVVSFDVCSAKEILCERICGRVVPQGDYAAFIQEVQYLVQQPAVRHELGENGRRVAERFFSPKPIVQQYEQLYRQLQGEIA